MLLMSKFVPINDTDYEKLDEYLTYNDFPVSRPNELNEWSLGNFLNKMRKIINKIKQDISVDIAIFLFVCEDFGNEHLVFPLGKLDRFNGLTIPHMVSLTLFMRLLPPLVQGFRRKKSDEIVWN